MKITCEHCGAMIDTDHEKKCNNCGAPYSTNKEYKRKKELEEKEKQASIRTREIGNEIAEETFKRFKTISKVSPIFMVIVFVIVIVIFFLVFKQIYNSFNRTNTFPTNNNSTENIDNYEEFDKLRINAELEIYAGNNMGSNINYLLDLVVKDNSKYNSHIITVTYKDNVFSSNEEILSLKKKINDDKDYYVTFSYNSNGYIDNVIINDSK